MILPQYKLAAAEGAVLELKLRMLCEAVLPLQSFAHANRLEDAENAVIAHFAAELQEGEAERLATCRQMRNKILHCDFRSARQKLANVGGEIGEGSVRFLRIQEGTPPAAQLASAMRDPRHSFQEVSATSSTREGTVFGWLLELGAAGDFVEAAKAFRESVLIIERLAHVNAREARDKRAE